MEVLKKTPCLYLMEFFKKIPYLYLFVILIIVSCVGFLYYFPCIYHNLIKHFGFNNDDCNDLRYRFLTIFGYAVGGVLLIIQIVISNRRSMALEKQVEAQLKNNIETRYNNTLQYLSKKESSLARLGSLYQLFYIAQSNHEYHPIMLNLFTEQLHILCSKK